MTRILEECIMNLQVLQPFSLLTVFLCNSLISAFNVSFISGVNNGYYVKGNFSSAPERSHNGIDNPVGKQWFLEMIVYMKLVCGVCIYLTNRTADTQFKEDIWILLTGIICFSFLFFWKNALKSPFPPSSIHWMDTYIISVCMNA